MNVAFLPVYPNPYQRLLRDALADEAIGVDFLERLPNINWLKTQIGRIEILHYHWLDGLYMNRFLTPAQVMKFVQHIRLAKELDYRLVWTAHNILPHQRLVPPLHKLIRRLMMSQADAVITHCQFGRRELLTHFPRRGPTVVIPHGHYRGVYPTVATRSAARKRLGLGADHFIYLALGNIAAYKGLDALTTAFNSVAEPDDIVLIAGRNRDQRLVSRLLQIAANSDQIQVRVGYITDEEMGIYLQAADVLVAPFRQILTSGSVITALSYGLPVIAPALGCLPELLTADAGILYQSDRPTALSQALYDIKARDPAVMNAAARRIADDLDWGPIAKQTADVYRACLKST